MICKLAISFKDLKKFIGKNIFILHRNYIDLAPNVSKSKNFNEFKKFMKKISTN
jgi:hypothetical protein